MTQQDFRHRLGTASVTMLIALSLNAAAIAQMCPGWNLANTLPRSGHAMAYDSARDVVVVFGGGDQAHTFGDTHEWSGQSWELRAVDGPAPARDARMVFDETRGVCVLVTPDNQTWEWNGQAWSMKSLGGIVPTRSRFALAYDAVRERTVLFGGRQIVSGSLCLQDTWEWDGQTWTQVAQSGPPPRERHAMTFDAARQRVMLHGGACASGPPMSDSWTWDGKVWTPIVGSGPAARINHSMAFDHRRQSVLLFGGSFFGNYDAATWEFNGSFWSMTAASGCPPRESHALVGRPDGVVCFGGFDGITTLGDLRQLSLGDGNNAWSILNLAAMPSPRRDPAMAYDAQRGVAVLFGGASNTSPFYYGDTWEWNGATWSLRVAPGPSSRAGSAIGYDSDRDVTVLYGGWGPGGLLRDTWEWDGTSWMLRDTFGPFGGSGARMVFDEARGVCLLFGGNAAGGGPGTNQTWAWNGELWTLLSNVGPPARFVQAMAYDPDREVVVMHGGYDNIAALNDTWEWNGATWILRSQQAEFHRYLHQMVYDELAGVMLAYGGTSFQNPYMGDLWRWEPASGQWQQLEQALPGYRLTHGMVYDSARRVSVVFGGSPSIPVSMMNDTWELSLHAPPSVQSHPASIAAAVGSAVALHVAASGGDLAFQWRRNGQPLVNGGTVSGAQTATLTIDPVTYTDSGSYDVVITSPCGEVTSDAAAVTVVQPGDADGDLDVDIDDLLAVIAHWGACPPQPPCSGDIAPLGGNGVVDIDDLLMVVANWGA